MQSCSGNSLRPSTVTDSRMPLRSSVIHSMNDFSCDPQLSDVFVDGNGVTCSAARSISIILPQLRAKERARSPSGVQRRWSNDLCHTSRWVFRFKRADFCGLFQCKFAHSACSGSAIADCVAERFGFQSSGSVSISDESRESTVPAKQPTRANPDLYRRCGPHSVRGESWPAKPVRRLTPVISDDSSPFGTPVSEPAPPPSLTATKGFTSEPVLQLSLDPKSFCVAHKR
jgi:hypothetical protein